MSATGVEYTDDMDEIVGELTPVEDFLPPPETLAQRLRPDPAPPAAALPRPTAAFLRREAARNRVRYRRLGRAPVDGQVRHPA